MYTQDYTHLCTPKTKYTYVHTRLYTYVYTKELYIHMYTQDYTHMCTQKTMYTYVHTRLYTYVYTKDYISVLKRPIYCTKETYILY